MIQKIRSWFSPAQEQKHIGSRLYGAMLFGYGATTPYRWNKDLIIQQAYERNLPFACAANLIAQTVASMPYKVESGHKGARVKSDDHPMLKALARNADLFDLFERITLYYAVLGESHALIESSNLTKKPLGVIVMPENLVTNIEGTWRKPIKGFEVKGRYVEQFDADDVIHVYRPSLSNYFEAMPVAIPAQDTIALHNAGMTWNKNIAQAGGMPPVVAKMAGADEQSAKQWKDIWRKQRGANNAHDLTIIPDVLEFVELNVNPHDAEWHQALLTSMRMIFMSLGVSSSLMNDAANKTYNNVKDSRKALYTEGCIPVAQRIVAAINKKMAHRYSDNPVLYVDTDNIEAIQEEKDRQWNRIIKAIDAGLITQNEGRAEIGKPPAKGPTADLLQNSRIINNIPRMDDSGNNPPNDADGQEDRDTPE